MNLNVLASIIAIAFSVAIATLIGNELRSAIRSGVFPSKGGGICAHKQPVAFWLSVGWDAACFLASCLVAVHTVIKLVSTGF